jgi:hypothetical protein
MTDDKENVGCVYVCVYVCVYEYIHTCMWFIYTCTQGMRIHTPYILYMVHNGVLFGHEE